MGRRSKLKVARSTMRAETKRTTRVSDIFRTALLDSLRLRRRRYWRDNPLQTREMSRSDCRYVPVRNLNRNKFAGL